MLRPKRHPVNVIHALLRVAAFFAATLLAHSWYTFFQLVSSHGLAPDIIGEGIVTNISSDEPIDIILAALLVDGASMKDPSAQFLAEMTCNHGVRAHILVKGHSEVLISKYTDKKEKLFSSKPCASLIVEVQPQAISKHRNRLKRLQQARDYQRKRVEETMVNNVDSTVIILVDLDLKGFEPDVMIEHAKAVLGGHDNLDALCAIGTFEWTPPGYYDAFATVLLPDTFLYPPKLRLKGTWPEEDKSLYWAFNKEAQRKVYRWIIEQGDNGAVPVPVRSCFGGVGVYKGDMWFNPQCSYSQIDPLDMKYADRRNGEPCEHVIMHNCMRRTYPNFTIAIHPKLKAIRY
jgi:hypothetical protein